MSHGHLEITIVEARKLKDMDAVGENDAYVELYLDKEHKQRTSVVKNTNSPTWNQTFTFTVQPGQDHLTLKVYDDDVVGKDDVGETKIRLKKVQEAGGHLDEWINLPTTFGRGSDGEVHVIMRLS